MLRHLLRTVNLFDTAKSVLFLCFLAACHGRTGGADQARGLVYYETYDPRSLDPALSTDVPTGEMVTLLFDGLTQFDPNGRLLPSLADRWRAERKGQRYVFHLRAGVKDVSLAVALGPPAVGEAWQQTAIGIELGQSIEQQRHHLAGGDVGRERRIERAGVVGLVV